MLQNQLAKGNNGLIKTKYLTFSIEADSLRAAKPRLNGLRQISQQLQAVGGIRRAAGRQGQAGPAPLYLPHG